MVNEGIIPAGSKISSEKKKQKHNPLDEMLENLEQYDEGCTAHSVMSSGE